jgi:hypothetical protein
MTLDSIKRAVDFVEPAVYMARPAAYPVEPMLRSRLKREQILVQRADVLTC